MNKEGRKPFRGETKKRLNLTISRKNIDTLEAIAEALGLPSRSEVVEYLAEKEFKELQDLGKSPSTHSAA